MATKGTKIIVRIPTWLNKRKNISNIAVFSPNASTMINFTHKITNFTLSLFWLQHLNFWILLNRHCYTLYAPEGHILFLLSVILSLYHSVLLSSARNFNLGYNFWMVIFHLSIPCDKTFLWASRFFYFDRPCDLDLGVWPTYWKL
jgi:hypothetical protein